MRLIVTGLNHRTAPVEVRERLAFEDGVLAEALGSLRSRPGLLEGMILSTCNRVEITVAAEEDADAGSLEAGELGPPTPDHALCGVPPVAGERSPAHPARTAESRRLRPRRPHDIRYCIASIGSEKSMRASSAATIRP